MSEIVREKNGRFIKKNVLRRKTKALEAMAAAKRNNLKKKEESKSEKIVSEAKFKFDGNRVVNMDELTKNLKCCSCEEILHLTNVIDENREGLYSILKIVCCTCKTINTVSTGKKIPINSQLRSDINLSAVLGAMSSGSGCTGLNTILNCMDIPTVSMSMYKRYERKVGPAIEEASKNSCGKAAMEERKLVLDNVEKICNNL